MTITDGRLNRADLLKAGAAGALGLTFAGQRARRGRCAIEATTLNLLTWSDHYANDQLTAVSKATAIQGRPTLFSRQRRRVPEDQADGQPVRHRLGRRALGARSTTRTG